MSAASMTGFCEFLGASGQRMRGSPQSSGFQARFYGFAGIRTGPAK
jgi:hypothetical protein